MTSPTDTAAPLPTPTRLPQALRLTDAERERMHADYVHLHRHPELSMQEHETAAWIERQLDEIGVEHFRCGGTGVVGILRHPESPEAATVAFRADFDGLPILEDTGLDYASTARGTLSDGPGTPDPEASVVQRTFAEEFGEIDVSCQGAFASGVDARPAEGWRTVSFETAPDEDIDAVFARGERSIEIEVFCNRGEPTVSEIEQNRLPD